MATKKAAKASMAESSFEFKDIVLGKVKGHPAWPARVVDPSSAPDNLRQPKRMASKGKYLVKFFQSGDYAWLADRDISKLQDHEIQAFLDNPHKKGADLKVAYQIAKDPEEWETEQAQAADEEEADRQQYIEEEKAREEDELEEEGQRAGKKRKRATEAKPKETKKQKAEGGGKKKAKGRGEGPTKVVREWRHHLQREFLSKAELQEESMAEIDDTFKEIEAFEMQLEWLQETKLGKVLKRIGQLPEDKVPLDSEYNIRERAKALQNKWAVEFGTGDEKRTSTNDDVGIDAAAIPDGEEEEEVMKDATEPQDDSMSEKEKSKEELPQLPKKLNGHHKKAAKKELEVEAEKEDDREDDKEAEKEAEKEDEKEEEKVDEKASEKEDAVMGEDQNGDKEGEADMDMDVDGEEPAAAAEVDATPDAPTNGV